MGGAAQTQAGALELTGTGVQQRWQELANHLTTPTFPMTPIFRQGRGPWRTNVPTRGRIPD